MKIRTLVTALAVTLVSAAASHAQLKIGIIDMNEAFVKYHKTQDAERAINAKREESKTQFDARAAELQKAIEQVNQLQLQLQEQQAELSDEARQTKINELNEKGNEARNMDREVAEFRAAKEQEIQEQFVRMRTEIIESIMKVVNRKIGAAGYDLVLDKSGLSMGQIPVVVYSRADMDFTNEIIAELNQGQ